MEFIVATSEVPALVRPQSTSDWNVRRHVIEHLYWTEDRELPEVMSMMKSTHGFIATKKQYKTAFKRWGLAKNIKTGEMSHIIRIQKRRRDHDKKATEFTVRNRQLSNEKIERFMKRYEHLCLEVESTPEIPIETGRTPAHIEYRTPGREYGAHSPASSAISACPSTGASPTETAFAPSTEGWVTISHHGASPAFDIGQWFRQYDHCVSPAAINQIQENMPKTGLLLSEDTASDANMSQEGSCFPMIAPTLNSGKNIAKREAWDDSKASVRDTHVAAAVRDTSISGQIEVHLDDSENSRKYTTDQIWMASRPPGTLIDPPCSSQRQGFMETVELTSIPNGGLLVEDRICPQDEASHQPIHDIQDLTFLLPIDQPLDIMGVATGTLNPAGMQESRGEKATSGFQSLNGGSTITIESTRVGSDSFQTYIPSPLSQDKSKDHELRHAARYGELSVVEQLVAYQDTDINGRCVKGWTALHYASYYGHLEVVITLLHHGADGNSQDNEKNTPLHFAAAWGYTSVCRTLLTIGRSIHLLNEHGELPFLCAIREGKLETLEFLLKQRIKGDIVLLQQPLLHAAVHFNRPEAVHMILGAGFEVNLERPYRWTKFGLDIHDWKPLQLAAYHGHRTILDTLLENDAKVDLRGKNGVTPLHIALQRGKTAVAIRLFEAGANPLLRVSEGNTTLHLAAAANDSILVAFLLEQNVPLNAVNIHGVTPVHYAAASGSTDAVISLIGQGADLGISCLHGRLPIHAATINGHTRILEYLLDLGGSVLKAGTSGNSLLHLAAKYRRLQAVKLLLARGADPNMWSFAPSLPLHDTLIDNDMQGPDSVMSVVEVLLAAGAEINHYDTYGLTPLHQAVMRRDLVLTGLFLQHNANTEAMDGLGRSVLDIAVAGTDVSMIQLLVDHGAGQFPSQVLPTAQPNIAVRGFGSSIQGSRVM